MNRNSTKIYYIVSLKTKLYLIDNLFSPSNAAKQKWRFKYHLDNGIYKNYWLLKYSPRFQPKNNQIVFKQFNKNEISAVFKNKIHNKQINKLIATGVITTPKKILKFNFTKLLSKLNKLSSIKHRNSIIEIMTIMPVFYFPKYQFLTQPKNTSIWDTPNYQVIFHNDYRIFISKNPDNNSAFQKYLHMEQQVQNVKLTLKDIYNKLSLQELLINHKLHSPKTLLTTPLSLIIKHTINQQN